MQQRENILWSHMKKKKLVRRENERGQGMKVKLARRFILRVKANSS